MPIFQRQQPANTIPLQINIPVQGQQQPVNLPAPVQQTQPTAPPESRPLVGGEGSLQQPAKHPSRRSIILPFAGA